MAGYPPTVEVQRQILAKMRDTFQQNGFAQEMDAEALRAQTPGNTEAERTAHEKQIKELEGSSKNAYAAARRMDEKLAKLPKPKPEKK